MESVEICCTSELLFLHLSFLSMCHSLPHLNLSPTLYLPRILLLHLSYNACTHCSMLDGNTATAHPSAVDISMEEEMVDNLPKTPATKRRKPRSKKDIKSAKEVEAGIWHVAAYKRGSLNEELVNMTPQVMYTPTPPHDL